MAETRRARAALTVRESGRGGGGEPSVASTRCATAVLFWAGEEGRCGGGGRGSDQNKKVLRWKTQAVK